MARGVAEPGEVFGDYELQEEIARGGMGVVFKVRQRSLDRVVALKMMLPGWLGSRASVRRFRMEAEAASRLRHPGIVSIHDVGQCAGQHFYSMDYIEGCNLVQRLERGPVAPELAARWVRVIAEAIHHAHQHGILHRDLKPANVLIDAQDEPHVTDFGLAKRLDDARDLTATGHVLGTPGFMPPEQADPSRGGVTVASDVYGLGAILYYVLTGEAPFRGAGMDDTIRKLLTEEPVPPSRRRAGVARDLETICLKCLNKEPLRRYDSAAALADDLHAWARHEPIRARPVAPLERLWFWGRRNPGLALVSLGLVAAVVGWVVSQQIMLEENRRGRATTEGLVQYLIEDLTEQLRPLGRLRLLDNVNRTVQRYYQGFPMQQKPSDPLAGKAQFHLNHAAVLREMGRLDEAEGSARAAIALLETLAQKAPSDPQRAAALAEAHAELRNILTGPDPAEAMRHARQTVRFWGRACELDPSDGQAKAKLANSRLELGSVLQAQQKTAEAAEEIRIATELLSALPDAQSASGPARDQLTLSFYYQGLIQFEQGDKEQARASFNRYLARTQEQARASDDPADARVAQNLAIAHSHVGHALLDMGDAAVAREHFREYQRLAEQLQRLDPGNVNYRRELALSLYWLAEALERTQGAQPEITRLLTRSCDGFQKLAADFPQGDVWQDHAARGVTLLAVWHGRCNETDRARQLFADETARQWRLLLLNPGRPSFHNRFIQALEWSENNGGPPGTAAADKVPRLQGWLQKALARSASESAGEKAPEPPAAGHPDAWPRTVATLHHQVAAAMASEQRFADARSQLEAALPIWKSVAQEQPDDPDAAVGVVRALCGMCTADLRGGDPSRAFESLRTLLDWLKTGRPAPTAIKPLKERVVALRTQFAALPGDRTEDQSAALEELDRSLDALQAP
jgi:tRNA A-37 threonylcarbamoyl transferase component Bud32/tetratricopeptide (TPR) repeat protein